MGKTLRRLLYAAGLVFTGVTVLLAYTINEMINRPDLASPGRLSDSEFAEFTTKTEDGIEIYGVYYQGAPEAGTILLCHGHGVTLRRMDDMVKFLRRAGYGILMFDFRAHGRSGGKYCAFGLHEWKDIKAVIAAAKEKGYLTESTPLGAYGRSMGAATLINGSEKLPEIKAFILESSFERLRKVAARDAWHHFRLPDTFLSDLVFWLTSQVIGFDYLSNKPEEKTGGIGSRPVFLIHDEKDYRADVSAFDSLKGRLPHAQSWVVKDAWHVCGHHKSPVEFEMRFLNFLHASGVPGRR